MIKQRRIHRHDCEIEIARTIPGRRLRSCCLHLARLWSRSKIAALAQEGMPHDVVSVGPGGRVMRRFDLAEVDAWISGRRQRQLTSLIKGGRYPHRAGGSR